MNVVSINAFSSMAWPTDTSHMPYDLYSFQITHQWLTSQQKKQPYYASWITTERSLQPTLWLTKQGNITFMNVCVREEQFLACFLVISLCISSNTTGRKEREKYK